MTDDLNTVRRELAEWAGMASVFFVESGTAALRLAIEVLTDESATVLLPAIGCWTLTTSVLEAGRAVAYGDVEDDLALAAGAAADAMVLVAPWGNPGDFARIRSRDATRIWDATLAPGGGLPREIAETFEAVVLSLGRSKPFDVGAGGILMVRDPSVAIAAQSHLMFGRAQNRWHQRTHRYVFSHLLAPQVVARWRSLRAELALLREQRECWNHALARSNLPLRSVVLPRDRRAGATSLVPHLLDDSFPFTADEVFSVALFMGVPLLLQPVTPPYLEPAGSDLSADCPRAQELAKRLVFIPTQSLTNKLIPQLGEFFDMLMAGGETFRKPYRVTSEACCVPDHRRHWLVHAVLGRKLDGQFCVFDPLESKSYAVSAAVAAALQARERS